MASRAACGSLCVSGVSPSALAVLSLRSRLQRPLLPRPCGVGSGDRKSEKVLPSPRPGAVQVQVIVLPKLGWRSSFVGPSLVSGVQDDFHQNHTEILLSLGSSAKGSAHLVLHRVCPRRPCSNGETAGISETLFWRSFIHVRSSLRERAGAAWYPPGASCYCVTCRDLTERTSGMCRDYQLSIT